jgi:hypothetical protein
MADLIIGCLPILILSQYLFPPIRRVFFYSIFSIFFAEFLSFFLWISLSFKMAAFFFAVSPPLYGFEIFDVILSLKAKKKKKKKKGKKKELWLGGPDAWATTPPPDPWHSPALLGLTP